eukprot:CAMPEP_0196729700 /NCGR_PEP_ID=MMETSP1091-20130531/10007_1 /TAXON_ID=302021 /ORGANISM="Rhodomonas sp., Strain CCMP768" /LENGTH=421 /DNA_ID=CAMNT_0042072615 /DNA_START=171 /DNA_END=1432 /DNA_ORIENTATION=-
MAQVEGIVASVQGLSARRDDWNSLLQQLEGQADVLTQNTKNIDLIVAQLNPSIHAIGVAFVMHLKVKSGDRNALSEDLFLTQVKQLLLNGDAEQLQFLRPKVCEICREFTETCRTSSHAMFGIKALVAGVEKLRPTPEHLTSVHGDLLQLCLVAKCFTPALPIIEQRVLKVSKESMQARDFVLYFYYGGMVLAAVKKFPEALDMFQLAFTMPCHALNEVVVECYKKYVLVSLIAQGEVPTLPKYTMSLVQRLSKSSCAEYQDLAQMVSSGKVGEVSGWVEKHTDMLRKDGNLGLAKQALAAGYRRSILALTQTFVTLSLADIAEQVSLPDAAHVKAEILDMIDKGQLVATIDEEKGMVSFDAEPEKTNSQQLLHKLVSEIQVSLDLNDKLRQVQDSIGASQAYLVKVSQQERQSRWGEPGG